jgi:twitching motility protein PilT
MVLSQRLVMNKDHTAPVLAYEKMVNSFKIKTFIRDGKTHQIRSQMQLPGDEYSSIDVSLAKLCIDNKITVEEGLKHADNAQFFQDMVKSRGVR